MSGMYGPYAMSREAFGTSWQPDSTAQEVIHSMGERGMTMWLGFANAGLPGEPALGPPAFMHRQSGVDNPGAPIGHHWMDSTHVTYGVLTLGYVYQNVKLEGSAFKGREPDQYHWDIEKPKLDSYA